ncbi:unnamed protein product [Boreogadus saida]
MFSTKSTTAPAQERDAAEGRPGGSTTQTWWRWRQRPDLVEAAPRPGGGTTQTWWRQHPDLVEAAPRPGGGTAQTWWRQRPDLVEVEAAPRPGGGSAQTWWRHHPDLVEVEAPPRPGGGTTQTWWRHHPDLVEAAPTATARYLSPMLPKPQVSYRTTSPGVVEANCSCVSRPPAEIVWNVERDNRTLGPPLSTQTAQGDGTTLVVSTLTVRAGLLKDVSIKCLVHHRGLESAIAVAMNTKISLLLTPTSNYPSSPRESGHCCFKAAVVGTALAILISVTTVAALLVLSLCFCLWKCFLHKDGEDV